MRLWLVLLVLSWKLRRHARKNGAFRRYIGTSRVRFLVKTADGRWGRLFVFDGGAVSSRPGAGHACDAALVWSDPATAVRVMLASGEEAAFAAAAEGKMRVEGMAYYVQWFNDAVKLVL